MSIPNEVIPVVNKPYYISYKDGTSEFEAPNGRKTTHILGLYDGGDDTHYIFKNIIYLFKDKTFIKDTNTGEAYYFKDEVQLRPSQERLFNAANSAPSTPSALGKRGQKDDSEENNKRPKIYSEAERKKALSLLNAMRSKSNTYGYTLSDLEHEQIEEALKRFSDDERKRFSYFTERMSPLDGGSKNKRRRRRKSQKVKTKRTRTRTRTRRARK